MNGFVYFISYGDTGWTKIGYAKSLVERMKTLQCASPEELTVEASVSARPQDERALHRALRLHRGRGEWFRSSTEVRLAMEMAIRGDPIEDIIAFANSPTPTSAKDLVKQLQVIQWTRWSKDDALPDFWRKRYREWLRDDHSIVDEADTTKLRSVA